MKRRNLIIVIICIICCACTNKNKFKEEYEKYNNEYTKIELEDTSIIKYSNKEEINKIIKEKTGVIYFGNPKDNLSRKAIETLLSAAINTGLDKIYYLETKKEIKEVENKQIPLVVFVLEGKIVSEHQGTIDNKSNLTEDETIKLYNIYTEGIHQVLQDTCEEECE